MKKYTITFTERQLTAVADVVRSHIFDMLEFDAEGKELPLDQYIAADKRVLENALCKMETTSWD